MKYEKIVLIVVFAAGVLVGKNLNYFKNDIFKITSSLSADSTSMSLETPEPLVVVLKDGNAFGSEPDLVSTMQGCEIKSKPGCSDRVICTGYAEGGSTSKIDVLMAQHKAEGVALSEAAQYVNKQSKMLEKLPNDLPVQDLQRYKIVGGQSFPKENLVAIAIGYNCK
jgi:hypothetical protein